MAQEQKLAVSALNVRIVDKDKRDYEALFRSLLRQRRPVRVYNNDYLILTSFGNSGVDRMRLQGALGRFTDIPEDADWLDTNSLEEADDDDKAAIHIPENLKPNYEAFYCGLFVQEHIFTFETFSDSERLSPRHVLKWLREATKSSRTLERFGPVEVDLIPDYGVLDRILESETLRRIEITIRKPNPDELTALQFDAVEARLTSLNAREEKIEYKSQEDGYLNLDEKTEALAKVGAENGSVEGHLQEDGAMKTIRTANHPMQMQEMFDPDEVSGISKFISLALRLVARVRENRA
ncbi:DUF4747 family protein [Erythrobacter litoralis]|uniref:DUF4747 family protein n=1 Tax=Erythrobacter litoralis TaxID=39960 RepID=UPI0024359743|nr:DUF4747 family protein [Erythrobacter litoralis]MDG6079224.1 DUF4747 family protein [Erythrobacter litoralis]